MFLFRVYWHFSGAAGENESGILALSWYRFVCLELDYKES
jgi:hypothetical protein